MNHCTRCREVKPDTEFTKQKNTRGEMVCCSRCKACKAEIARERNLAARGPAWTEIAGQKIRVSILARNLNLIEAGNEGDCWEWQGKSFVGGYGSTGIVYRGTRLLAHHFSWIWHNQEPVPDDKQLCHSCDNRKCCNPSHLFICTQFENVHDMLDKDRQNPPKGESHPRAKLTEADVLAIREASKSGVTYLEIARQYGVSNVMVSLIVRQKNWKHI